MKASLTILFSFIALMLAQFACCGDCTQTPVEVSQPSDAGNSAPSDSNAGQIIVSGALNKTYTPVRVSIGRFGPVAIRLYMYEETPADLSRMGDALTLDFPADLQPGAYPFENSVDNPSVSMWATYGTTDGTPANYKSIQGTLILTVVGSTFSGQFQFTATDPADVSKTIEISGSFTDLPFDQ